MGDRGGDRNWQGTSLTKQEFFKKQEDVPVEISPKDPNLEPLTNFQRIPRSWRIHQTLQKNCVYDRPTPVQKWGIPLLMQNKDVMASAQTGSGKTAFFLYPSINRVLEQRDRGQRNGRENGQAAPAVLVMAPTRELCYQIFEEAEKFVKGSGLKLAVVYGGTEYKHSLSQIRDGCDVVVATPGRLDDLVTRKAITLKSVEILILDEADRMLDIGFEPQIRNIVQKQGMPKNRQTCMTSATFPENVQFLAQDFLKDYVFMAVGQVGAANSSISQKLLWVEDNEKNSTLFGILLLQKEAGKTLVFVNTKQSAQELESFLAELNYNAVSIHGDKSQAQREKSLEMFKYLRSASL